MDLKCGAIRKAHTTLDVMANPLRIGIRKMDVIRMINQDKISVKCANAPSNSNTFNPNGYQ